MACSIGFGTQQCAGWLDLWLNQPSQPSSYEPAKLSELGRCKLLEWLARLALVLSNAMAGSIWLAHGSDSWLE